MSAPAIRRSIFDKRWQSWALPSTHFRPRCARLTTVSHTAQESSIPAPLLNSKAAISSRKTTRARSRAASIPSPPPAASHPDIPIRRPTRSVLPARPATKAAALSLDETTQSLLPLLRAQKPHYITAHIHDRPYLLTAGDVLRLPFLMHGVAPGDVLRLNRASVLGSRDYTLKAGSEGTQSLASTLREKGLLGGLGGGRRDNAYLDDRLFVCRAVVVGTEAEPMRIMEKTKRRQRHVKHVRSKHRYTVLRISEVTVRSLEEVESMLNGNVVEDADGFNEIHEVVTRERVAAI